MTRAVYLTNILLLSSLHPFPERSLGKFEPPNGKVILFVGQELEAIGGTAKYNDGYFDHFPAAGGVTEYTNFLPGLMSCGAKIKGLDGLTSLDNWGDGPENMS